MTNILKKILIMLSLFQGLASSAQSYNGSKYWYGEKDFNLYSGPLDPSFGNNFRNGDLDFEDRKFNESFGFDKTSISLYELSNFFKDHIRPSYYCPPYEFIDSAEYVHYLHRLTSISINYEFLRRIHIALYQLGEKESLCEIDYKSVLKSCEPQSEDMKLFSKRVSEFFPDIIDWGKYPLLLKNGNSSRLSKYHGKTIDVVNSLFKDDNLEVSLQRACDYSKKEIANLCSERDTFYGMSEFPKIHEYIRSTSAFKVANATGNGDSCMGRFIDLNKQKESIDLEQKAILKAEVDRFVDTSGRMFWYGSLREFDELGVSLVDIEEVVVEPVKVVKKPTVTKVVKNTPRPIVVEPKPIKKVVRKIVKKKIKKVSAFSLALKEYRKTGKMTAFNMQHMNSDYKYSKRVLKMLNGPLRPYQTRKALSDMKKVDKLGSEAKPLSFLFLRYLIDYKLHQGLYNIKGILGDEFYVINDVEKDRTPVLVRVDNDATTKFKWQIWIKKAPN